LDEWLYNQKIQGISGIDTRDLTKILRTNGVMMCALVTSDNEIDETTVINDLKKATNYDSEKFMDVVSTKEIQQFGGDKESVVVIDTGAKNAILRNIRQMGYNVIKVPWDTPAEKILSYKPKGVVISNGPGDPKNCVDTITTTKSLLEKNIPLLGICLGAQIIALSGGSTTYKLKYGHRGQNKPCIDLSNNQVCVTSQNHGYCIDPKSLQNSEFNLWFTNADDKTVEGIKHKEKKCIAVQFHPEASPGPYDCKFVFKELQDLMEGKSAKK
jgi:carbamoyl-phosphate synthase small subunit